MAQPGRAPAAGPELEITITHDSSGWKAVPKDPANGAVVDNQGYVNFKCSQAGGCRVYTDPTNAFVNETNGYLTINQGSNNKFQLAAVTDDTYVSYSVEDPGGARPRNIPESGPYSIQSGNPPMQGGEKHDR